MSFKRAVEFLFGRDLWGSRFGAMAAMTFASLLWYVLDWCMSTSFRPLSYWMTYPVNILAALLLLLPYTLTRRAWVQCVFMAVVDGFLLANIAYARTYQTAIPPESYLLAGNLADFGSSVLNSFRIQDVVFLLILIGGAVGYHYIRRPLPVKTWGRYLCLTGIMALVVGVGMGTRGGFYKDAHSLAQHAYRITCPPAIYTPLGWVIYCNMEVRRNAEIDQTPMIEQWLERHEELYPYQALPDSVAPRKNLIIILCESLETWPIGLELNGKAVTPNLNAMVADSTTFYAPRVLTQVAAGRSIEAQLLLTSGLLPMNGVVYSNSFADSTYPTLNKALTEKYGSKSYILTCDQPFTWNQTNIALAFGYEKLYDRSTWEIDEWVAHRKTPSDGTFLRQATKLVDDLWPEGEPVMLSFLTYSGHFPFELPENLRDPEFDLSGLGLPKILEDYIVMTHYVDAQLPTMVNYLKSRPDYDDTLILITGDHEGLAGDRSASVAAADFVEREQFTPFIVLNSPVAGRHEDVMGQVDMYSTLLPLLGLDDYFWKGMGKSVLTADSVPGVAISSMTGKIVGDTTEVSADRMQDLKGARAVSDAIIRQDYFKSRTK